MRNMQYLKIVICGLLKYKNILFRVFEASIYYAYDKKEKKLYVKTSTGNYEISLDDYYAKEEARKLAERQAQLKAFCAKRLKERFGNHSEAIVEAFKQAYPERPIADVLYVETMLRAPALKTARLKADQHGAPVYNYMFAWDTPLEGGFAMSYHCSELPFVFNNVVMSKASAVGGKQAEILADRMSRACINFARYGNPNHSDIPDWPAFTRENGYTMIFGNECQIKKNHDYKLMKLLVPDYVF